jgi:hypothetical protein
VTFTPITDPTFVNGLRLTAATSITDKTSVEHFFSAEVNEALQLLIGPLKMHPDAPQSLWKWLIDEIGTASSPFLCDYLAVFIVLFRDIRVPSLTAAYWETLLASPIFDDRINLLQRQPG